ncbi:MAG TPA: RNase adapter RapZ [Acidimicrobiia bacterium]
MADPRVVIVTGMSGAGRSQAANVLEDLGYFVVDNLPPPLIVDVVDRAGLFEGAREKVAVVVDTRGGVTAADVNGAIFGLLSRGVPTTVLYLDADDDVLIRRFEETRRTHPVKEGTLAEKIAFERTSLEEIRGLADVIVDTSDLNVHELRRRLESAFDEGSPVRRMRVDIVSFGFKRGMPRVADILFDVRFLPNPHWIPELRPLTGRDQPVKDYVLGQEDAMEFIERAQSMLEWLVPRYVTEGKAYLTIGIGCTGGRHRSVAIANELADRLALDAVITVRHRDSAEETQA